MDRIIWFDAYSEHALPIILQTMSVLGLPSDAIIVNGYSNDNALIRLLDVYGIRHVFWDYTNKCPVDTSCTLVVSVFARRIIPTRFLSLSQYGGLNIHPSLLPMHRGCFAIPWALINGDSKTGLSVHTLSHPVDTGLLVHSKEWQISSYDTAISLHLRFLHEAILLYPEIISTYVSNADQGFSNSYTLLSPEHPPHPRTLPYNGVIQEDWDDTHIERFIRAMYYPPFDPASYRGHHILTFEQYVNAKSQNLC